MTDQLPRIGVVRVAALDRAAFVLAARGLAAERVAIDPDAPATAAEVACRIVAAGDGDVPLAAHDRLRAAFGRVGGHLAIPLPTGGHDLSVAIAAGVADTAAAVARRSYVRPDHRALVARRAAAALAALHAAIDRAAAGGVPACRDRSAGRCLDQFIRALACVPDALPAPCHRTTAAPSSLAVARRRGWIVSSPAQNAESTG